MLLYSYHMFLRQLPLHTPNETHAQLMKFLLLIHWSPTHTQLHTHPSKPHLSRKAKMLLMKAERLAGATAWEK